MTGIDADFARRIQLTIGTQVAAPIPWVKAIVDAADQLRARDAYDEKLANEVGPRSWTLADSVQCDGCGRHTTDPETCECGKEWCPECRESGEGCGRCAVDARFEARCRL